MWPGLVGGWVDVAWFGGRVGSCGLVWWEGEEAWFGGKRVGRCGLVWWEGG